MAQTEQEPLSSAACEARLGDIGLEDVMQTPGPTSAGKPVKGGVDGAQVEEAEYHGIVHGLGQVRSAQSAGYVYEGARNARHGNPIEPVHVVGVDRA